MVPSSFIAKIVLSKQKKSLKNHLEELLYKRTEFGNNAAVKHQRLVERDALKEFKKLFDEHLLVKPGIFIDRQFYFICSSPSSLYGSDHVLNVKCPLKGYNRNFDIAIRKLSLWDLSTGNLNKKHEWYIELQSDLRITGRKFGFIMVWLGEWRGRPQYRILEDPAKGHLFL